MKILITGEPGIGKTTLIKAIVKKLGNKCIGFWTEEVRDKETHKRVGFKVVSNEGKSSLFAHKTFYSKHLVGSYGVNVKRFEEVVLPLLEKCLNERDKIIVMDELGKMEFFSKAFVEMVRHIIFNPAYKVIATLPIRDFHPFVRQIRKLPGSIYIELTKENREHMLEDIMGMVNGFRA